MQKIYQDNPCSHNGAMRDNYSWGQSIADVDAYINVSIIDRLILLHHNHLLLQIVLS